MCISSSLAVNGFSVLGVHHAQLRKTAVSRAWGTHIARYSSVGVSARVMKSPNFSFLKDLICSQVPRWSAWRERARTTVGPVRE